MRPPPKPNSCPTWADEIFGKHTSRRSTVDHHATPFPCRTNAPQAAIAHSIGHIGHTPASAPTSMDEVFGRSKVIGGLISEYRRAA